MTGGSRNWRHWLAFAALSATYYAHAGMFGSYLPLWLQSIGFSVLSIGWLTALQSVTRVFAPYLWGLLSDRSGNRVKWLRWCASSALMWCVGLFWARDAWGVSFLLLFLFSHTSGMMSMNEAAMAHLVSEGGQFDAKRYGRIRLCGSVGFMVSVFLAGAWFQGQGMATFPVWAIASLALLTLAAWCLPTLLEHETPSRTPADNSAQNSLEAPTRALTEGAKRDASNSAASTRSVTMVSVTSVLRQPQVRWFLAALFFHVLAHMGLYVFFSLYLDALGYSKTQIGILWAVAVVVEIAWFFTQGRWLPRFSLTGWLMLASVVAFFRMGFTALAGTSLWMMLLLQCLHGITFAAHHTACVALISHYFPGALRGRGQAIYTLVGYGLTGVVGGTLGGVLVSAFGLASVYWACSVSALVGWYGAWRLWRLVHAPAVQRASESWGKQP